MANKKINQLVLKTTIQSTDLFPLGDATTGQLYKKTIAELQAAIGGAVISVNGLVGTVVLDTDDIQELASPTNKYFTDARARAAISLTTTGNSGASTYSSSTGVLNVPAYTLAGLGGITASFLSGGTGITYNSGTGVISYSGTVFTDASIRALVSAGAGLSYNSSTGVFSYSGTVYTDSSIRALISLTTNGSSGASTYNNTTGVLNVPTYTLAGLGGISLTSLSGSAPITYNSSTGAIGITQASGSTNGFLSSTDWTTFNSKQNALTLGNVTESVSNVLMFPDGGTNKTIGNLSIQVVQAGSTTNGFLSTTDWNTFNNKQGTITLTTTGTSGAATFSGGTLNIPQYQAVLTNPVTGTGTAGYHAKWTSSSAIGNSLIFDDGTSVFVNATSGGYNTPRLLVNNGSGVSIGFQVIADAGGRVLRFQTSDYNNSNTGSALRIGFGAASGNTYTTINAYSAGESTTNNLILNQGGGNVGIGSTTTSLWQGQFLQISNDLIVGKLSVNGYSYLSHNVAYDGSAFKSINGGSGILVGFSGSDGFNIDLASGASSAGSSYPTFSTKFKVTAAGVTTLYGTNDQTRFILQNTDGASYTSFTEQEIRMWRPNDSGSYFTIATQPLSGSWSGDGGGIRFAPRNATAAFITGTGNTLLGTTTNNGERLYVSGSIRATGSITANSDARLKKNIERIENALEKVGQISGYTYNTIYDEDRHAGVIAQEIDEVLPEIVNTGNDGLMGVEYGNLSALLIEAIKDLKGQNESLKARLTALEK